MRNNIRYLPYLLLLSILSTARADSFVDFFRAVGVDNVSTVRELLARGFDPNAVDEKGQSALHLAARDGSPRVLTLLAAQPQVRVDTPNSHGETALMLAALKGDLAAAQTLVERGAQVNRAGWTPLHYAATRDEDTQVPAWLLDRGARIDAPSPNRSTALMMAARYGVESTVDLLLARGADAKLRNDLNLTAGDFARSAGRDKLALRLDALAR